MKFKIIASSLLVAGLVSGCGNHFEVAPPSEIISTNPLAPLQSNSASNKILHDVATGLQQNTVSTTGTSLTDAQIQALIQTAAAAIQAQGLAGSSDLNALLPVIIQGLTQAIGNLQISGSNPQIADLMASIGKLLIGSVTSGNSAGIGNDVVQLISQSLFKNLPSAGVSSGNLSQVSGSLMSFLVAHLSQLGLSIGPLSGLLQSLASGATMGVGGINAGNLGATLISDILNQIGAGSIQGLAGAGGMSAGSAIVQTLLGAIVNGAKLGLSASLGPQVGIGLDIAQLLISLISGQSAGMASSSMPSVQQQLISTFLQLLASKI
jgi:hypothetical protein